MQQLTQKKIKQLLHYNSFTGVFTWEINRNGQPEKGKVAGYKHPRGYIGIMIDGKSYYAHRLAWLYTYGYLPEHQVDHKNGICSDNRISKLRHVTNRCNLQNQRIHINNTSGFPGVHWYKKYKKWSAQIRINSKRYHLGYYNSPLEAALARYTTEVQCPQWTCNYRSELVKAIKISWPEFQPGRV